MRYANISIIEGTGASQLGIGVVAARIAEMIGRNEDAVVPIGSYQERFRCDAVIAVSSGSRWRHQSADADSG